MEQLTPAMLQDWLQRPGTFTLIDVREPWEHEAYSIGGLLLPMSELMARAGEVPKDGNTVIYCEKGIRSVIAIQRLEAMGYTGLYNLAGGMKAWRAAMQ